MPPDAPESPDGVSSPFSGAGRGARTSSRCSTRAPVFELPPGCRVVGVWPRAKQQQLSKGASDASGLSASFGVTRDSPCAEEIFVKLERHDVVRLECVGNVGRVAGHRLVERELDFAPDL